jgi:Protein of unknown function (DUF3363)
LTCRPAGFLAHYATGFSRVPSLVIDIVALEDGAELGSLQRSTRSLMGQMEKDLGTRLGWVAVDHHDTGHPNTHTHIVVRGVTEDGTILNIGGDYIAHSIRARASEIVTLELGWQTELEVQQKLRQEVDEDRFTRLDVAHLKEVNDEGLIDLRPGAEQNRAISAGPTTTGDGTDAGSSRPAPADRQCHAPGVGTARRGPGCGALCHPSDEVTSPIVGRVLGKGLAEELGDEKYLIIDGIDGRAHHGEIADPDQMDGVRRGGIVEVVPPPTEPHVADRTIASVARDNADLCRPSGHLIEARRTVHVRMTTTTAISRRMYSAGALIVGIERTVGGMGSAISRYRDQEKQEANHR